MNQHTGIRENPCIYGVFATPMASKATSNKQTKNSYFSRLQVPFFCCIVVSVPNEEQQKNIYMEVHCYDEQRKND